MRAALVMMAAHAFGQNPPAGRVLDAETGLPLAGATVQLNGTKVVLSNAEGYFAFGSLADNAYQLTVSFVGYTTYSKRVWTKDAPWRITLVPAPILTDEVIVTATRAQENTPVTFKTLDKEAIEKQNFGKDFPYLLEQTASVVTTSDAGTGVGYTGVRIRGSDATRVNVTLNGIPYNDSESLGVFWVDLPDLASSVSSVQVQRGVGTSTNGAGAFGASVNIQTTQLTTNPYAVVDNSVGSFNTRKHTLQVGTGLLNNRFTFDGRLSNIASDGYIDRASANLTSYYISGGYYGKNSMLRFNMFSGKEVTYQSWYGTPEARVKNDEQGMQDYIARNGLDAEEAENLLTSGRTYNFYTYDNQVDDYTQTHYQLIYAWDVAPALTLNAALHYTKGKGFYEQYKKDQDLADYGFERPIVGQDTLFSTDLIRRRWLDNDFYGATFSMEYNPVAGLSILVGGAWNQYDGDHFGELIWAQYAGNTTIRDRYYDNNGLKTDFTAYTKVSWQLQEKMLLFADLQYRQVGYALQGIDSDRRNINQEHEYRFFNPKAGVSYSLAGHGQVYASFAIGNKEPNRSDFIDWPITQTPTHETLQNLEAGFRKKTDKLNLQANFYWMNYRNQLVLTGQLNDVGSPLRTNVNKSLRAGIELEVAALLTKQWQLMGNVTLSQNSIAKFSEVLYDYGTNWDKYDEVVIDYTNTRIAFSPNITAGATLVFKPLAGANISWVHKYVGKQYLDNTQNENRQLPAYYISDLVSSYKFSVWGIKQVGIKLAVYNLFNVMYEANGYTWGYLGGGNEVRENFYYPQAGIHFMAGVSLSF